MTKIISMALAYTASITLLWGGFDILQIVREYGWGGFASINLVFGVGGIIGAAWILAAIDEIKQRHKIQIRREYENGRLISCFLT